MEETTMLRRLRRGDGAALEALMEQYLPYVSAVVWGVLGHALPHTDGEEVAADVFVAAWDHAGDLRPGKVKAWLGTVARNKARNRLRGAGLLLPLEEDVLELPSPDDPAGEVERAELRALLRQAVEALGPPDRDIFVRYYYYQQPVRTIAQAVGMPENTVKTRLHRGRQKLKDALMQGGFVYDGTIF